MIVVGYLTTKNKQIDLPPSLLGLPRPLLILSGFPVKLNGGGKSSVLDGEEATEVAVEPGPDESN